MTDDPLDPRWVDAVRAHAEATPPTPEAWTAIEERAAVEATDPADLRSGRRPWLLAAAAVALVVLGLAAALAVRSDDEDDGVRTGEPDVVVPTPETPVRVTGATTVLESPDHGPEMCFGGIAESDPPQCGGLPLVGWDWDRVEGEESRLGTTWGTYRVTGDYDGERLVVTEPPVPDDGSTPDPDAPPDPVFSTPCPEPPGGWVVRDPNRVTGDDRAAVQAAVDAEPDYGLLWIDRSIPVGGTGNERGVLNVTFTGDLDRHRAEIEALWGGPVCVSETDVTWDDLQRAADEVHRSMEGEPLVVAGLPLRVRSISSGNAWQELHIEVDFAPPGAEEALAEQLEVPVRLMPRLRPSG